jgi:hypothetical protein
VWLALDTGQRAIPVTASRQLAQEAQHKVAVLRPSLGDGAFVVVEITEPLVQQ